jgi:hypothetical protein
MAQVDCQYGLNKAATIDMRCVHKINDSSMCGKFQ